MPEQFNDPVFLGNLGAFIVSMCLCLPVGYVVANFLFWRNRKK